MLSSLLLPRCRICRFRNCPMAGVGVNITATIITTARSIHLVCVCCSSADQRVKDDAERAMADLRVNIMPHERQAMSKPVADGGAKSGKKRKKSPNGKASRAGEAACGDPYLVRDSSCRRRLASDFFAASNCLSCSCLLVALWLVLRFDRPLNGRELS